VWRHQSFDWACNCPSQQSALRAVREHDWFLRSELPNLAEAVYARGRLDEAEQVTEEAQALAGAGVTAEAESCLRTALDLHQQRRATVLADRTRAALARLTSHPGRPPAGCIPSRMSADSAGPAA
jgi:hypothetical protein